MRKTARCTVPLLLLLALAGCDELTSDLEPGSVPLSEIITLQRTRTGALPGDRVAVDTLLAMIPMGANNRVVTFRTTGGSFEFTAGAKEYKTSAQVDSLYSVDKLVARAYLRSDTITANVTVSASVSDYTTYLAIPFVRP